MKIAFAGLRHAHIFVLERMARANPDVTITGWWEEDEAARREVCFPEPAYDSYEALLADPQVDAVAIGDWYGIRGRRIIQALKAGKHVLSDKPLCTSMAELDEIEKLCGQTGCKIGCMLDLRYDPALRLAQKIIRSGKLGIIHALSFTGQHPLQWGTRPMWYFEEGKHGGTLNDIAIHGLDAVHMITGMPYVKTRHARQWNAFAAHAPDFCDCAQFMGELENGAGLMADVSYSAPNHAAFVLPSYWRFSFWGEKGWLECRFGENAVTLALAEDRQPRVLAAEPAERDCLTDLMNAISGADTWLDTQTVLDSTRRALELQRTADLMGKDENR